MNCSAVDRELRPYTPEEVGRLVQMMRGGLGWSQETLAEISGVVTRTIQRLEAGEGSSADTRQAVCRAFQIDDPHWLSRSHEIMTPEAAEREAARIREGFVAVDVVQVDGRALVRRIAESHPGIGMRAVSPGNVGTPDRHAEDLFAGLVDAVTHLLDDLEDMGMVEMLAVGDELQSTMDELAAHGWGVRLGSRVANVNAFPHRLAISYVVVAPVRSTTTTVLVPKLVAR